jgi:muconolactone delta-isomerase
MQFLTLSRRCSKLCGEVDFQRRLEAEAGMVRDLRQAGIIRQIWHRGDAPGECLLIEAQNEESARAVLEMSPLVRTGLFEIDAVVPLRAYDGFAGSP